MSKWANIGRVLITVASIQFKMRDKMPFPTTTYKLHILLDCNGKKVENHGDILEKSSKIFVFS